MFAGLSLDQAPPLQAPAKFFLLAPLIVVCGFVLLLFGDISLSSHDPQSIAFLHIITIGFMIFVMFGALLQMLPVVASAVIPNVKKVANITYYALLIGLFCFFVGFYIYSGELLGIGALSLFVGIGYFLYNCLIELWKVKQKSMIVWGIFASLSLMMLSFFVGLFLLLSHSFALFSDIHYTLVDFHKYSMFFGSFFMLICAISFQVIPMFWVSQSYSDLEQKYIIYGVLIAIGMLFVDHFAFAYLLSMVALFYIYTTYQKLKNRKRKIKDHTVWLWNASLISLAVAVASWGFTEEFAFVLFGGFAIVLMVGMLYKIVPFLVWFHLSSKGIFDIPSMKEMIPNNKINIQKYLLLASLILFAFGWTNLGAIIGIGAFVLLYHNLKIAMNIFESNKERNSTV
jgi:hypothetical protein